MTVGDGDIYAVSHRKEVHNLDGELAAKRSITLEYDGRCLAFVKSTGELWVGSKTGKIHVYSTESLE